MLDRAVREVFFSIARCPNVMRYYSGETAQPCATIIATQKAPDVADFQLPEPWVGRIDVAPILFVSSNPSIGKDAHATAASADAVVWESHQLAFGGGARRYIIDGTRTVRPDGSIIKSVRYWSSVRARAHELIPDRAIVPGEDYALTEIVHCKSEDERGVREALQTCTALHLDAIFRVSAAVVVVAVGRLAARRLGTMTDLPPTEVSLGGRNRWLVALEHPSSFDGPKTFARKLTEDQLRLMQRVVGHARQ